MKVELKEVEKEGFKPFKIELTIETVEELKDLHNRMNIASRTVNRHLGNKFCIDGQSQPIYSLLNDKLYECT